MFLPSPDLSAIKEWVDLLLGVALLVGGLIAGLWAYIKYVVERGILPPVEFDIGCEPLGEQKDNKILEITIHIKNNGSSTLVASDIRIDIRHLTDIDKLTFLSDNINSPGYGRLKFPNSVKAKSSTQDKTARGLQVMKYDSFVQPGIDQRYGFVTFVPKTTTFVLVWSSFQYAQRPSTIQRFLLLISRKLGLYQYSLTHVYEPHTVERAFHIA